MSQYVVYYSMAKAFRISPKEVDKMDTVLVDAMLVLAAERAKFEEEEMRNARR